MKLTKKDVVEIQHKGQKYNVLIDEEDYEKVSEYNWCGAKGRTGGIYCVATNRDRPKMHRLIMSAPKDKEVDHINHNTLDNRKNNLRLVTRGENKQNLSGAKSNSQSGIRGVYRDKSSKSNWRASVRVNGVKYGKNFKTKEEAEEYVIELRKKYLPFSNEAL